MNCKSCESNINENNRFCSNCGSKIVHERITLSGTWEEFIGPFFSWDNNFWRTFLGLFTNPKDVLEAYISGARKKYFQPFSYIILYATIAIFFYKIFPLEITPEISNSFANGNKIAESTGNNMSLDSKNYTDLMMSYYNFFLLLLLPLYALISFLVFKKKGNNFSEHLIFNSYIQTNFGYLSLVLQLILVSIIGWQFTNYSLLISFIFIFYLIYVFKKLYNLNFKQVCIAFIKYTLFFIAFSLITIILIAIFVVIYFSLTK